MLLDIKVKKGFGNKNQILKIVFESIIDGTLLGVLGACLTLKK